MATAQDSKLFVANTSNVKEMKNGRPMNVQIGATALPNCACVELGDAGVDVMDHVFAIQGEAHLNKFKAGNYVIVAPEIMVEQARMTDGHIGKYRLDANGVFTAYELHKHDRLELSLQYFLDAGLVETALTEGAEPEGYNFRIISVRTMAQGMIIQPDAQSLYDDAQLKMVKIEVIG